MTDQDWNLNKQLVNYILHTLITMSAYRRQKDKRFISH